MGWACAAMTVWIASEVAMGIGVGGSFLLAAKALLHILDKEKENDSA